MNKIPKSIQLAILRNPTCHATYANAMKRGTPYMTMLEEMVVALVDSYEALVRAHYEYALADCRPMKIFVDDHTRFCDELSEPSTKGKSYVRVIN